MGDADDFPSGTPVTTTNLIDAVVYDTGDDDDDGLLVLLQASQPQVDEDAGGNSAIDSVQRCPDGAGGARVTTSFIAAPASPGAANCRFDFGDAPTPYPTTAADDGARHSTVGTLILGAQRDAEDDGVPSPLADSDDSGGVDDEDGVTFGNVFAPGVTADVTVTFTGGSGLLNAWFDWNADNDWDDAGEHAVVDVPVDDLFATTVDVSVAVPAAAVLFSGIFPVDNADFGDAPASYGDARHTLSDNLTLGASVDRDDGTQATADATGDDDDGSDDEDGVTFGDLIWDGSTQFTADVTVVSSGAGRVSAWLDIDDSGTFEHPAEAIINNELVVAGTNSFAITASSALAFGHHIARFRLSTAGDLSPTGSAANGEVEDYQVLALGCGDGRVDGDEACDDGNTAGGDGCAADCSAVETNFVCATPGAACDCVSGYAGADCLTECAGGAATPCSGQGTCSEGTSGDGTCTCDEGFWDTDCAQTCTCDNACLRDFCDQVTGACSSVPVDDVGAWEATFGTGVPGSANGQLNAPYGVDVDASGHVYVADRDNHRIQKFDAAGAFVAAWGTAGTGDAELASPYDVAVDRTGGFVYVSDFGNHRIQKFAPDGTYLTQWGAEGAADGQLNHPRGLAVDATGHVYVADRDNARIQKFDAAGTHQATFAAGEFTLLVDLAVDGAGNIYAVDAGANLVRKYNAAGEALFEWGTTGNADGQFNLPIDVAVDAAGNVYVADNSNHRVQWFDAYDGRFRGAFGGQGSGPGELTHPQGIATDGAGHIYVADTNNHRVEKFAPAKACDDLDLCTNNDACSGGVCVAGLPTVCDDGDPCTADTCDSTTGACETPAATTSAVARYAWGESGADPGQLHLPGRVAVWDTRVYVADRDTLNRVQIFERDGTYVGAITTSSQANALAFDAQGRLYIATAAGVERRAAATNNLEGTFGGAGAVGVAVAPDGDVWVARSPDTLERYSGSGVLRQHIANGQTTAPLDFAGISAVAVDAAGAVYVTEEGNHRVQKLTAAGDYVGVWDGTGGLGQLAGALDVAVAGGFVYVAEDSGRVQRFHLDGTFVDGFSDAPAAMGVAVDGDDIWLTDAAGKVRAYTKATIACTDADACTGSDVCVASLCVGDGAPVCGDGEICTTAMAEGCDDGGTLGGDGCDARCGVEDGASCLGEPSSCTTGCAEDCTVLAADDFQDASLDAQWIANTTVGTVTEGAGGVTLTGRGVLFTAAQLEPAAYTGLAIDSLWTLPHAGSQAMVLTRSANDTAGSFSAPSTHVACFVYDQALQLLVDGASQQSVPLSYAPGDRVRVQMEDDGAYVTCTAWSVTAMGAAARLTRAVPEDKAFDHVGFTGETGSGPAATSVLLDVTITP
ncbi:MAG: hypothetical protein CSA66_02510, partial [Proteobacteria bacterium]